MGSSRLQQTVYDTLRLTFSDFTVRENNRPDWLVTTDGERLELDVWIVELNVAVEIQGDQHYVYVPHFHGVYENFLAQNKRDAAKKTICEKRGIVLYEVDRVEDVPGIVMLIQDWAEHQGLYRSLKKKTKRKYTTEDFAPPKLNFRFQENLAKRTQNILKRLPDAKMPDDKTTLMLSRISRCVHKLAGNNDNKKNLIDAYANLLKNYSQYHRTADFERRKRFRGKIARIEQDVENIARKLNC